MLAHGALWRRQASSLLQRAPTRARAPRPSTSPLWRPSPNPASRARTRRFQSTDSKPPKPPLSENPTAGAPQSRRISRILAGASRFMPKRLRGALQDLRSAPLSHIFAFLVLHEITAILPIFGLTYAFYVLDYVPGSLAFLPQDGSERWTNYFRKKRWFGFGPEDDVTSQEDGINMSESDLMREDISEERRETSTPSNKQAPTDWKSMVSAGLWDAKPKPQLKEDVSSPPGLNGTYEEVKIEKTQDFSELSKISKITLQLVAAYGITKILLVPRIALSLWLTPWLARGFVGFRRGLKRTRR
ncbi:hypothetical protein F4803DRAFT_307287 [Xylaria telfairii]|nr:hypothetical protein F4803DRAFT_307287 [Xylaria telfairii]